VVFGTVIYALANTGPDDLSNLLIASTISFPTCDPFVPIPALTVMLYVVPIDFELFPVNGTIASGPASPIIPTVGPFIIPPFANFGILTVVPLKIVDPPLYFGSEVNLVFAARIACNVVLFAAAILARESPGLTVTVVDPVAPAVVPDATPAVVVPAPDPVRLSRSLSKSPLAASS